MQYSFLLEKGQGSFCCGRGIYDLLSDKEVRKFLYGRSKTERQGRDILVSMVCHREKFMSQEPGTETKN
jgi:hypothetical protein